MASALGGFFRIACISAAVCPCSTRAMRSKKTRVTSPFSSKGNWCCSRPPESRRPDGRSRYPAPAAELCPPTLWISS